MLNSFFKSLKVRYLFKKPLDISAIIGIMLIIAGVVVMNFFSKSVAH